MSIRSNDLNSIWGSWSPFSYGRRLWQISYLKNNGVTAIPLVESAGKLKYVDAVGAKVKDAKLLGISFGD